MLYIKLNEPNNLVYNVQKIFGKLKYGDVKPYIEDMLRYKAFERILGTPEDLQTVDVVGCLTPFGTCTLNNISTSIQILILSKLAIKRNTPICFVAGLVGDNYLPELMKICKNTELVSLYCPEKLLPQLSCPERHIIEQYVRE